MDMVVSRIDPALGEEIPAYDLSRLSSALPYIRRERTRTFAEFARASIRDVLGPRVFDAAEVELITTLDHVLLMNRGGSFDVISLPAAAQLAPSFHPAVADFDGDGDEDLFLSQNFFPNEVNVQRYGSGRGLLLRNDGNGNFRRLRTRTSGIRIYGDQRGAAVADFDGDGRIDLAVSQNGAETLLFRNTGAEPGLRVRIEGTPDNPRAVGAVLRVRYADDVLGPAREVRLGAGYWSVDDAVQVLGLADDPLSLDVRWPDGTSTTVPIDDDTRELTVTWNR